MPFAKTFSAALSGLDVKTVEIEVSLESVGDKTSIVFVGLPDTAVRESRDRIYTSLSRMNVHIPYGRVIINLAPADLRKSGTAYDLPMALCVMATCSQAINDDHLRDTMIIGELALEGKVRPIHGALSIAVYAKSIGMKRLILPKINAKEAAMAEGIDVYGVSSLKEACDVLMKPGMIPPEHVNLDEIYHQNLTDATPDFIDVKGQESAKRAILAAAAGNHNLLMVGNPGCGKTLLARRIPGILPPLTVDEALEVTKIHSIAGILDSKRGLIVERPFRSPHHTVSDGGLVGGSMNPRPGELSLAHNGVLFLDELPEFRRNALEVLRQPLESGEVTLARASGTFVFPAKVMLVAAMNPCPCGYYGSPIRQCTCNPFQRSNYRSRISGPLLDRIDLHIEVAPVNHETLMRRRQGESTASMREKVLTARAIQLQRYKGTGIRYNADMTPRLLDKYCQLDSAAQQEIKHVITDLKLSARAYDRILRVSRTLADLAQQENISAENIREASNYRFLDRECW